MSLLQQDPTHTQEVPAGEDLAKGSSHIFWASLAAFVVVTVAITLFLIADHKPPAAVGEVTQIWAHPVHTLSTAVDANGVRGNTEMFDQVLVFANIRVRNQSDQPIVLREMTTNITLDDGIHSSYGASANDYDRIFIAYPQLAGLRSKTLVRETVVAPGQVMDGMIVSAFHIAPSVWATRKDLNFSIDFKYHPTLLLVPKTQVIEQ